MPNMIRWSPRTPALSFSENNALDSNAVAADEAPPSAAFCSLCDLASLLSRYLDSLLFDQPIKHFICDNA